MSALLYVRSLIAAIVVSTTLAGCSTLTQLLPSQREAQERAQRIHELQLQVMRYADEYAGRMREAVSEYQRGSVDAQDRLNAQEWKVQQSNATYTIASGANPFINMLDMVVLATLSRMVMDDVGMMDHDRERSRPLRQMHAELEREAWRLVEGLLNDEQKAQLHDVFAHWREKHPQVQSVAYIHFSEFAAAAGIELKEDRSPSSLFSLFGLDVFSGLDPAVREITETRELAERSIFYLQRAPTLLDLEVERLAYKLAVTPEAAELLRDAENISRIGVASDRLVTMLPDVLAREREAAISQLLGEMEQRSRSLATATSEVRMTLEAGTETAQALQGTLATLDRLAARYAALKPSGTSQESAPFDVREYINLLQETQATARELDALAERVDRILPQTAGVARGAAESIRGLMDRAFIQLLGLILVLSVSALVVALAYRRITRSARWRAALQ